ncbi:MAG: membrane protein insertase YidC [Actinomycetota bacterium]|nr:membrane protein insertase YidC [Actinomycetota bacterium]
MFQLLAGLLAFFYSVIPNYAVAIALLTLTVMLVLSPLTLKSTRSMLSMQKLQPEMKRLQQKHKGDRQKLNEEMMALYKEHKVNPVAGCLPMLLQLPVFFVMYQVIQGLTRTAEGGGFDPKYLDKSTELYQALRASGGEMTSFGVDLARRATDSHGSFATALPYFIIVALVVVTQYYQSRQSMARTSRTSQTPQQQMVLKVLPVFFGFISLSIPAGVNVYFLVSALFRIAQTGAMYRFDPTLVAHAKKHAQEIEAKAVEVERGKPAKSGKDGAKAVKVERGKPAKSGKDGAKPVKVERGKPAKSGKDGAKPVKSGPARPAKPVRPAPPKSGRNGRGSSRPSQKRRSKKGR